MPPLPSSDLIAVGQREQFAQPGAQLAHERLDRRAGGARCRSTPRPRSRDARAPARRTFEGPQPKRPSAGFSASGITACRRGRGIVASCGASSLTGPRGCDGRGAQARGVIARRFPVVWLHPNASRDGLPSVAKPGPPPVGGRHSGRSPRAYDLRMPAVRETRRARPPAGGSRASRQYSGAGPSVSPAAKGSRVRAGPSRRRAATPPSPRHAPRAPA